MPVRPRLPGAAQSADGGAVRHGGRHRTAHSRPRIRAGRRPAGRVPLLHLGGAQERPARRPDRRLRRRSRRAFAHGSAAFRSRAKAAGRSGAGVVRNRGHRNRHAAALVRGARRPPLEAGVQREGESAGSARTSGSRSLAQPHENRHRPRHHQFRRWPTSTSARPKTASFPPLHIFETPQLVAAGRVEPRRTLPSFLFLEDGQPVGAVRARAGRAGAHAAGALGQIVALESGCGPHRQDPAVGFAGDRAACSRRWKFRRASSPSSARSGTARKGAPLAEQDIVLTVPASFDEEARELTVMAAREAGIERLTLLEEPAAAFYSWIAQQPGAIAQEAVRRPDRCWSATWAAAPAISA